MTEPDPHIDRDVSPRRFAQGVGVVLQTVGGLLFISTCCLCSLGNLWTPAMERAMVIRQLEVDDAPKSSLANLRNDPGKAATTISVAFSTVGGLALAIFGLGLQADKPRAAYGALVTVIVLLLLLLLAGAGLWLGESSWAIRVWHALVTLAVLALAGLIVAALKQVRAHPPSGELESLPPDFDERQYRNH